MEKLLYENLTYKMIGAVQEGFKEVGPGYLESAYEDTLCYELDFGKICYCRTVSL